MGVISGLLAGFFGVGGGAITVPLLLLTNLPLKFAIGMSSLQMVLSSYFGTFINNKQEKKLSILSFYPLGIGGIIGGVIGGNLVDTFEEKTLSYLFLGLLLFALVRVFISKTDKEPRFSPTKPVLILVGIVIGSISSMLGVGGAILLIPLLVGYMGFSTKDASKIGLFFVTFTSTSAFLTLYSLGYVDLEKGAIVAVSSLLGVRLGILLRDRVSLTSHKGLVITMYVVLTGIFLYKF
ncbi:MAG: sulfite exporter TauE/SafE family protein [Campylobacterales bacterium]|nr:sulfite exporter TauE/SafE family protein [Campylobacterales bacterium]